MSERECVRRPRTSGVGGMPTTTVRAGQTWADCERGQIRVVAVADGYAMLKRRRRNPFLASTDQMLAGEYGWELVSEAPESAAPARSGAQQQGQPPDWYARREQHAREMGYAGLAEALADLERRRQPTQQGSREVGSEKENDRPLGAD